MRSAASVATVTFERVRRPPWPVGPHSCHLAHPVSDHHRSPHSSSALALLVASLPLAPRSSRQRTAQVTQLLTDLSPAHVLLLLLASALCVCTCVVAIQHPALGGRSACSGRCPRPLARPELLSGLIAQFLSCHIRHRHACASMCALAPVPRRSSAERRYEKTRSLGGRSACNGSCNDGS